MSLYTYKDKRRTNPLFNGVKQARKKYLSIRGNGNWKENNGFRLSQKQIIKNNKENNLLQTVPIPIQFDLLPPTRFFSFSWRLLYSSMKFLFIFYRVIAYLLDLLQFQFISLIRENKKTKTNATESFLNPFLTHHHIHY